MSKDITGKISLPTFDREGENFALFQIMLKARGLSKGFR